MFCGINSRIKRAVEEHPHRQISEVPYSEHKSQWAATGHYRSAALQIRDNKDN